MSFRHILPAAVLAFVALPFAVGCSGSDDGQSTEVGEKAGDKVGDRGAGGSDGAKGANVDGKPATGMPGKTATASDAPAQELPTTSPTEFVKARDEAVKAIVDGQASSAGVTSFVLGRGEPEPMILRAASGAAKEVANGFEVHGDITIETPAGPITLFHADVVFERNASGGIERLVGTVDLPAPSLGALEGFSIESPVRATVGWDLGKNLKGKVEAPMLDDRHYIVFEYSVGLAANAGPVSIELAGGKGGTMVLDPMDPSFYVTGGLLGLDEVGPLSDLGLGLSARGLLKFEPQVTWGVESEAQEFSGHLYAKGTVDLKRLPISIDGEMVVNLDPTGKGRVLLANGAPPEGLELGVNGQVNLSFDAKVATLKLPLAKATLGAKLTATNAHAYISGEIGPDADWLPTLMPFVPQAKARIAAYVDTDFEKSHLNAEMDLTMKANKLYGLLPQTASLGLKDINVGTATLSADKTGIRVTGQAKTPSLPFIHPTASLAVDALLPASDPSAFYLTMSGELSLGDFPLGSASTRIDKTGFFASGTFHTPVSDISMSGTITSNGATIDGKARTM